MPTTTEKRPTKRIRAKRVAIAKDVLARLESHKRRFQPSNNEGFVTTKLPAASTDVLAAIESGCKVCALGAAAVAMLTRGDAPVGSLVDEHDLLYGAVHVYRHAVHDALDPVFGKKTRCLIECAFEKQQMSGWDYVDETEVDAAIKFGRRHRSPRARLRAIYENIVANDGEFKP